MRASLRTRQSASRWLLALALVYGAAPMLRAQTSPPNPSNPSDNPQGPGLPIASPATGGAISPSPFEPADHAFLRLDTNRTGFLTREQVSSLDGFPFDEADANKDGRLNAGEFANVWSRYLTRK